MSEDSSSRPSTSKEKWKEREAKRLKSTVLGHLAFYIQVRMPEEMYNNDTCNVKKYAPAETSKTKRKNKGNKKKIDSTTRTQTNKREVVKSRENGKSKNKKHNEDLRYHEVTGSPSSTERDCLKKKAFEDKSRKKSKKKIKSAKSSENSAKDDFFRQLNKSPYSVDPLDPIVNRRKNAILKRKESERIAANASYLLKTLPLADVVEIHKYHSTTKSQLRCSSSLSSHPDGMLHSCKAVKYLTDNDDRQSARKYIIKKAKVREESKKKEKEKKEEKITSSITEDEDSLNSVRGAPTTTESEESSTTDLVDESDLGSDTSEQDDSSSLESENDEQETEALNEKNVPELYQDQLRTSSDESSQEESEEESSGHQESKEDSSEDKMQEGHIRSVISDESLKQSSHQDDHKGVFIENPVDADSINYSKPPKQDTSSETEEEPSSSGSDETSSLDSSIAQMLQEAKISSRSSLSSASSSSDEETKNSSTAQLPLRKLEGSQPLGYRTVSSRANNKTGEPITESGGEKLDFVRILN